MTEQCSQLRKDGRCAKSIHPSYRIWFFWDLLVRWHCFKKNQSLCVSGVNDWTTFRQVYVSLRGHHHKHSLSHNFFSFLEPGSTPSNREPLSPCDSVSASVTPLKSAFNTPIPINGHASVEQHRDVVPGQISYNAVVVSAIQFVLGAWLWVSGQQVGSISCTGLGYWVVFDSFGVALSKVVPGWLSRSSKNAGFSEKEREKIRRPFGYDFS